MKNSISIVCMAVLLATSVGCTAFDAGRASMLRMTRMVKPKPFDGTAVPESEVDEWGFVGDQGRADQEREKDPDPWLRDLIMSPEARQIERNLGFD